MHSWPSPAAGRAHGGSSYNEPLITAEWAVDVFKAARPAGLKTVHLERQRHARSARLHPAVDRLYKIDLKAMTIKRYRELAACSNTSSTPSAWSTSGVLARDRDPDRARFNDDDAQ